MATPAQIRGLLLEEAVLYLLRATGYQTVDDPGDDPTLCRGSAGLNVHGRGAEHQIDAIADFVVHQPFGNPQRLLLEAKCLDAAKNVGLPTIRNAYGTLVDVGQHWTNPAVPDAAGGRQIPKGRYHYQYAIFSATGYTAEAEAYAFAHDIYLVPVARSRYFQPIVNAIRQVPPAMAVGGRPNINVHLTELRAEVRRSSAVGTLSRLL